MTKYEEIMKNMTPETLATLGVKMVTLNNTELYYVTSSGQLYPTNEYDRALVHEYNWLTAAPPEDTQGTCPDRNANECESESYETESECDGCEKECQDCDKENKVEE